MLLLLLLLLFLLLCLTTQTYMQDVEHGFGVQDVVPITVMDAWGRPTAAASVTVHASLLEGASKGKPAAGSGQTLQAGSSPGEYLFTTADLQSHPGTYV